MPKLIGLFLLLVSSGQAIASNVPLNPQQPGHYVVTRGDTLWDIAAKFLSNPWQWHEIWHRNPQIQDPDRIYPGDVIALATDGHQPRIYVETPSEIRLQPEIRTSPIVEPIPTIPLTAIRPFLTKPQVVGRGDLKAAPYVVDFAEEHVVGGAGDRFYARAIFDDRPTAYTVVREGPPLKDAETGEIRGYEAIYVGEAQLQKTGDPASLLLTRAEREVLIGDRLLPMQDEKIELSFIPRAPHSVISGHIIGVLGGVSQIGQHQVVILDRGIEDGIETGHVLDIFRSGRTTRDVIGWSAGETVRLPSEKTGTLMVFKPFERISYALVMRADRALHVRDSVRTPTL